MVNHQMLQSKFLLDLEEDELCFDPEFVRADADLRKDLAEVALELTRILEEVTYAIEDLDPSE